MTRQPKDWGDMFFVAINVVGLLIVVGAMILGGVIAYQRHQAEIAVMLKEKK